MKTILLYTLIISLTVFIACLTYSKSIIMDNPYIIKKKYSVIYINRNFFRKVRFVILSSLPCILVLSYRYGIGTDYFNYKEIFNQYIRHGLAIEPGFKIIMSLSNKYMNGFDSLIFITSVMSVIPVFIWIVKNNKRKQIGIVVLVLLSIYFGIWFNAIRQSIAIGFVILAYNQIVERDFLKFTFLILIATQFHSSALIVYPLYFLVSKNSNNSSICITKSKKKLFLWISIFILLITGYVFIGESLNLPYAKYINSYSEAGKTGGRTVYYFLANIFLYIPEVKLCSKLITKNPNFIFYYILLSIEFVLFLFSWRIGFAFRLAYFFSITHAVLIPATIDASSKENRVFIKIYFIVVLLVNFYLTTFYLGYNGLYEYTSIFG